MMVAWILTGAAFAVDTDNDGVDDADDRCAWEDDTVDLDLNQVPDCDESLLLEFGFDQPASVSSYTAHWSTTTVGHASTTDGAGYSPESGAMLVSRPAAAIQPEDEWVMKSACVRVYPWHDYAVSTQVAPDNSSWTYMTLSVMQFTSPDCSGAAGWPYSTMDHEQRFRQVGSPRVYQTLTGQYQPSPGVRSARVWVQSSRPNNPSDATTGFVDNLSMHVIVDPPPPIDDDPVGPPPDPSAD